MHQRETANQSWAWLIFLLGISSLLMTVWFLAYPVTALLCTLSGIFICLFALVLSESKAVLSDYPADRRET